MAALPQTAIGKIYKPALRQAAIGRSLRERLERAGLSEQAQVEVRDEAGVTTVIFMLQPHASPDASPQALAEAVRRIMAPFALRYRIEAALATIA